MAPNTGGGKPLTAAQKQASLMLRLAVGQTPTWMVL
jgi:hypothetical protein